jgi:hypothetical protein
MKLVSIFDIKGFHWSVVTTFNKMKDTSTPERRDHECFPDENILPRQQLSERSSKGCSDHRG